MIDLDAIISKHSNTVLGKRLYDLLVKSWNHKEFICGVLSDCNDDAKKQEMIDFIEAGNTNSDDIILESLAIAGKIKRK